MRIYRFPFNKIKKEKANIILYGMGNVGKQYLAQCMTADNIKVLFAIDGHSELSFVKMHDIQVYNPEIIRALEDDQFDYIVIAMDHDQNAKDIKDFAVNLGVPEEKIIYHIDYYDSRKYLRSPELYPWHNPSFSWFGEDLIVAGLFQCLGIENPSYLDVGCNHPYEGNNTALLYLKGSCGVNIDANFNCIQLMNAERPDDTNICVGVCGGGVGFEMVFIMLGYYDALI